MLTLLFTLAAIWTVFWFAMILLDSDDGVASTNAVCPKCAATQNKASATAATAPELDSAKKQSEQLSKQPAQAAAKQTTVDVDSKTAAVTANTNSNLTPLFKTADEADDLKIIKGIGVVMEKTLNDLGIMTFKQLADFQRSDVKMVSDVLSSENAGFGDRIDRDEWVNQAKVLAQKAA